jgi:hypothetical protein
MAEKEKGKKAKEDPKKKKDDKDKLKMEDLDKVSGGFPGAPKPGHFSEN